jgi:hypothetical protein
MTPEEVAERALRSRVASQKRAAAYISWARTDDPSSRSAPGRKAAWDRFEREADPEGRLSQEERERRAHYLRSAWFSQLGLKSGEARRKAKAPATTTDAPDAIATPTKPRPSPQGDEIYGKPNHIS